MTRVIATLLLLVYVGAGIASACLPQEQMPRLVAVAGAALVLAAAVGIVVQLGREHQA
jgi:hypothetical protein